MYWFSAFLILMAGLGLVWTLKFSAHCEQCDELVKETGAVLFLGGIWALTLVIFALVLVFTHG